MRAEFIINFNATKSQFEGTLLPQAKAYELKIDGTTTVLI